MAKYSKEELSSLPVVSQSHHTVCSDGKIFLKKSRSSEGAFEIVREYSVQNILGLNATLLPGPPVSLLTPKYGDQLQYVNEQIVRASIRTMYHIAESTKSKTSELSSVTPTVNDFRDKVERRIAERVAEGRNPVKLFNFLPEPKSFTNDELVLCHSDPRPENWLIQDDRNLLLIDWESAVLAPWEFAVASYASYIYEYGNPELLEAIFDEALKIKPLDKNTVVWSAAVRRVSVCSWYFDDEGDESGEEWMRGFTDAWRKIEKLL